MAEAASPVKHVERLFLDYNPIFTLSSVIGKGKTRIIQHIKYKAGVTTPPGAGAICVD